LNNLVYQAWSPQAFLSQRSHKVFAFQTESGARQAFSDPLHDRQGSHSLGRHSYVAAAAREAGSVAEAKLTAARKSAKDTDLDSRYTLQPLAIHVQFLGPTNDSDRKFLLNLDRTISPQ